MSTFIIIIISFCIFIGLMFGIILILDRSDRNRDNYLKTLKNRKVTLFSKSHHLKYKIEGVDKKEFYVYGYNEDIDSKYASLGRIRIEYQEDLDDFKNEFLTVNDIINYEEDQKHRVDERNKAIKGDFT